MTQLSRENDLKNNHITAIFELPWAANFFRIVPSLEHSSLSRHIVVFFDITN